MNAVLAVDGGQSGIRMRHSASAHTVEVGGVTRANDTVAEVARAITEAWKLGEFPPADRVVLGLTTAPGSRAEDSGSAVNRLCALVAKATGASEVWLADDTVTAHFGALAGASGVCLVVGTGVACLSVPVRGEPRRFDGLGYLLGDEGGAFWIGRRALRTAIRDFDRGEPGPLTKLARARFGSIDGLHIRLHDAQSPVNDIAQFARDVIEAAKPDSAPDHTAATKIIAEAAERLCSTVLDAAETFPDGDVPVALGGRLLAAGSQLRNELDSLLSRYARIRVQSALGTPLDGALQLGNSATPGQYQNLVHVWKVERAA